MLDASAIIELLLDTPSGREVGAVLAARDEIGVPHLVDAEVGQVLRRYAARGELQPVVADRLLDDFLDLQLVRYPHTPLLRRAFELRESTTVYDALYLALAEELDCPLLTADQRLASVPGCLATVEVLTGPRRPGSTVR